MRYYLKYTTAQLNEMSDVEWAEAYQDLFWCRKEEAKHNKVMSDE